MRVARLNPTALGLIAVAFSVIAMTGCSVDGIDGEEVENLAPNVWLASAPPEGSEDTYTIRLFWGGWDPDGQIAYYEFAITDNDNGPFNPADTTGSDKWHRVVANDSVFTFSADQQSNPNDNTDLSQKFERSHTFFIRAVDDEGRSSTQPAYRSFTAFTISPEISVTVPPKLSFGPAAVPPITTFRWTATDFISDENTSQDPESVQFVLKSTSEFNGNWNATVDWIRNAPDSVWSNGKAAQNGGGPGSWLYYGLPNDSGKFWTTPPLDFGQYVFAIRAMDEAGAITPVLDENRNVRRIVAQARTTGPTLTVTNQYIGSTSGWNSCIPQTTILDLPAGVPLRFSWTADASQYGGVVSGYRYGWDISDLDDPDQWETDFTPFTSSTASSPQRTFFFGSHVFTVEVVDNSGFCTRQQIRVNIVQFTLAKPLLLIDDNREPTVQQDQNIGFDKSGAPTDEEADAFWLDMLDGVASFNPDADIIEIIGSRTINLASFAQYETVIYDVAGGYSVAAQFPLLYEYIRFVPKDAGSAGGGKTQPNILSLFMAAGGHLLLVGNQPMSMVVNRDVVATSFRHPLMYEWELEGNASTDSPPNLDDPVGDLSFAYLDMCLDVVDYSRHFPTLTRTQDLVCQTIVGIRDINVSTNRRTDTMRRATSIDPNFPTLAIRPESSGPGKIYNENLGGIDAEIYNPQYFLDYCPYVPRQTRGCFEPIYGLECLDVNEPTFGAPVAFWTSRYEHVVAEAPGAVGARSAVFGFRPVFMEPTLVKPAIEYILYDEWQLDRVSN